MGTLSQLCEAKRTTDDLCDEAPRNVLLSATCVPKYDKKGDKRNDIEKTKSK